jgi:3-hydroxyisobutyrate dehydrogenase-like beta-hydroxyacid dehydrogenase
MHNPLHLGFVGFGEAGSNLAKGFRSAGVTTLTAYDIRTDDPEFGPTIRARAAESGVVLVQSPEQLASSTSIILSVVTASAALDAATQTGRFLGPRHLYADLNSVSPSLKQDIDRVITSSGARFVEAAVMAPVPPYAHRVPMLLGGAGAPDFVEALQPLGMRLEVVSHEVGVAAATKMCRSIVVKGLEALLVECVLGASQYKAEDRVFASLSESFPGINWKKMADYMVGRVVVHGERRAHEMEEVAATLKAIGIDPIMAEATARRQHWASELNLRSRFGPDGPATYKEVLQTLSTSTAKTE